MAFFACGKTQMPSSEGSSFFLFAQSNELTTRTVLNADWTVSWISTDALTVFNAGAGETDYSGRCKFGITDPAVGQFSLTDGTLVTGKESFDWYVAYPYMEYASAPNSTKGYTVNRTPVQKGYNSSAHLKESDLLVGKAFAVAAGQAPDITMDHVGTLMNFTVVNNSGSPAAITGLTLDATSGGSYITGSFSMNWGDSSAKPALSATTMGSAKAYTCALSVVGEDGLPITEPVGIGESVDIYMAVAPFSIPAGESIGITVSGSNGVSEQVKTFASGIEFKAGTYNTATVSYEKPEKALFYETFGTVAVATGNVSSYDKSGLTTFYPEDKANYSYSPYNNASFQNTAYDGQTTSGAYCRFPKNTAALTILNIDLHGSHSLTFSYLNDVEYTIALKWRYNGTSDWTTAATSSATGIVSHDFTVENPDNKTIDIQLQLTSDVTTDAIFPAVDNWKLVAND